MRNDGRRITSDSRAEVYARHLRGLDGTSLDGVTKTIKYLRAHGINLDIAQKYHLGLVNPVGPEDRQYEGRLCIPTLTRKGVVAFKYRCVEPHNCKAQPGDHKKYLAPHGQETRLFNPEAFFAADQVIGVTEGEINAIVATEFIIPTVGIPGVDTWKPNRKPWKLAFADYETVLIFADMKDDPSERHPEGAGMFLARMIADDLGAKARLVQCDRDFDVAGMVAAGNAAKLRERAGIGERNTMERLRGNSQESR
jgi:hypothetical protein